MHTPIHLHTHKNKQAYTHRYTNKDMGTKSYRHKHTNKHLNTQTNIHR